MRRNFISYVGLGLKGMAMGAADVVPGVSGGTIAFISGIYEEFIQTIDQLDFDVFKTWRQSGFKNMFKTYNLGFLLALFIGMFLSFLSFAKLTEYLLRAHPILIWSFFFGLVVASTIYIGRQIKTWSITKVISLILGCAIAYYITIAEPQATPSSWYFILFSGFIAIIAMILPGISGSFILILLGSYTVMLGTFNDFIEAVLSQDFDLLKVSLFRIVLFIIGCIVGLKLFSKGLKWMFAHRKELTLSLLTGFMIGSLNKIWPWKEILTTRVNRHGEEVPLLEKSILPGSYEGDSQLVYALILGVLGFAVIFILERLSKTKTIHAD